MVRVCIGLFRQVKFRQGRRRGFPFVSGENWPVPAPRAAPGKESSSFWLVLGLAGCPFFSCVFAPAFRAYRWACVTCCGSGGAVVNRRHAQTQTVRPRCIVLR